LGAFRAVQEALTNVAKHARASRVSVVTRAAPTALGITVTDDGVGLSPEDLKKPSAFGMLAMTERVRGLDPGRDSGRDGLVRGRRVDAEPAVEPPGFLRDAAQAP
ncbi:MAG: hypothetical protein J0L61_09610, partial [Planctomycetes bacterium]|nr:hypothetical protein [Planctomycetota bacterium]